VPVGRTEFILARVLSSEGKLPEAHREAELAVQQLSKAQGPQHPETLAAAGIASAP
jgi:hypothetical protein